MQKKKRHFAYLSKSLATIMNCVIPSYVFNYQQCFLVNEYIYILIRNINVCNDLRRIGPFCCNVTLSMNLRDINDTINQIPNVSSMRNYHKKKAKKKISFFLRGLRGVCAFRSCYMGLHPLSHKRHPFQSGV